MAVDFDQLMSLFSQATEAHAPEEWDTFLDKECADDEDLRRQLKQLLDAHAHGGSLLDHPAVEGISTDLLANENIVRNAASNCTTPDVDHVPLDFLAPPQQPGSIGQLGQYHILDVIGRGGMGIVLKAQDAKLNRVVAIKVLAPELASNPTARKRFAREAQAAAAVSHDHVVTIYAVEEGNGRQGLPYLVMEFVDGESLQEKIGRQGDLEIKEILRIGRQIAAGLAAAHEQGLIHRDVKPSNILLQNGVQRVQITDFGLARAVDDVGMTKTGEVTGTPQYMSPEQAQGQSVDARSDLFSLGSVLYAMCTGRSPFRADTTVASLRRVCDDTPRPLREVNPNVPDWMVRILDRLLEKDADKRFQSAEEVAELLGKHLAHLQEPASKPFPGTPTMPSPKSVRPLRRWLSAAVALTFAIVSLGISEATGVTQVADYVATVLRLRTPHGTLVLEIDDPDLKVNIEGNGETLTISGAEIESLELKPGEYQVRATKSGEPIREELVTITRGNRTLLSLALVPPVNDPSVSSSLTASVLKEVTRFKGPVTNVVSVAISPTGNLIAAGSTDGIYIFDWATEHVRHVLKGHIGLAADLQFTRDGSQLLSAGRDHTIRLWDLDDGKEIQRFEGHTDWVKTASLSPDEKTIVSGGRDGTIRTWHTETGKQILKTPVAANREPLLILSVRFSPDGKGIASSQSDGSVILWNSETLQRSTEFSAHEGAVHSVRFSADGLTLLTCGNDNCAFLWNIKTQSRIHWFHHASNVNSAEFTPDERHIVTGGADHIISIWSADTGKQVAKAVASSHCTRHIAVTRDARHVVSAGGLYPVRRDGAVVGWKSDGDHDLHVWELPEGVWLKETELLISAPGSMPNVASITDQPVEGGSVIMPEVERYPTTHTGPVLSIAVAPEGRVIATGSSDDTVLLVDRETRTALQKLTGDTAYELQFTSDGRQLLSAGDDGTVRLWDVETGDEIRRFVGHDSWVSSVDLSVDGRRVLTSSHDGTIRVWDFDSGNQLHRIDMAGKRRKVFSVRFDADGQRFVSAHLDGTVTIWSASTQGEIVTIPAHEGMAYIARFSPGGRTLLTTGSDNVACLWDIDSRRRLQVFPHADIVTEGEFLSDGQSVVTSSGQNVLRVWNVDTGREMAVAEGLTHCMSSLALLPDEQHLVSAGGLLDARIENERRVWIGDGDYDIRLWRLPVPVPVQDLESDQPTD